MTNLTSRFKTSLWQKISLILLGICLTVILLEAGLRLGGFIILSLQEHTNVLSARNKGTYRILCVGESTTQGQYPRFLEEILNQRNIGIRFSAIDKGLVGTNTSTILNNIESYLAAYKPDMVIVMMGINDEGAYMPLETMTSSRAILFIKSLRTYKLARLLWLHMITKIRSINRPMNTLIQPKDLNFGLVKCYAAQDEEETFKKCIEANPKDPRCYVELGLSYRDQEKFSLAEGVFKKGIEVNPKDPSCYAELAWVYLIQGKPSLAEETFKKGIEVNPKDPRCYAELAWMYQIQGKLPLTEEAFKKGIEANPQDFRCYAELGKMYQAQGKLSLAEETFKKGIEVNPKDPKYYTRLGWLYQNQGKLPLAEQVFKKGIEVNPKDPSCYAELAWLYLIQGKLSLAEEAFKKGIEVNPQDFNCYARLGSVYQAQGKLSLAEEVFKKGIEVSPNDDRTYGLLALVYEEKGQMDLARRYYSKADELRIKDYNKITANNYRKLKEILDSHNVRLVCVQYPMRSLDLLKRIFGKDASGFIFVDNEHSFKGAIRKEGYNAYFNDMFGGDFGHCTYKGNRLLAENIADVILKEVFSK